MHLRLNACTLYNYYHIAILCTCMIVLTLVISEAAIVVFSYVEQQSLSCKYSYILRHLLIIVIVSIAVDVIASCM